jgi:hypothetical protein
MFGHYNNVCTFNSWHSFVCLAFHVGLGKESREITLRNAKRAIVNLAQQLR